MVSYSIVSTYDNNFAVTFLVSLFLLLSLSQ